MSHVLSAGDRFTRWTVLGRGDRNKWGEVLWLCRCDCGTEKAISGRDLRSRNYQSCGCLRVRHGLVRDSRRTYESYKGMIRRCYDPDHVHYENYGGRGIGVCDRWRNDPKAFFTDMGERPEGLTLDRIDNDGHYEPSNCRWATWTVQAANKRPRRPRTATAAA